jgi:hypothetical protein
LPFFSHLSFLSPVKLSLFLGKIVFASLSTIKAKSDHNRKSSTSITTTIAPTMPKVKKIRSAALAAKESRHAPLGQMIQEDENRGKYASAIRNRGGKKSKDEKDEDELMDEKTTKKILELSREQQLELEREDMQRDHQRKRNNNQAPGSDDEDEDDDDDEESVPLEDDEEE